MSFAGLLASAEPLGDGLRLAVPPDWHQGRTAYGGFSTAIAYEAARRVGGELPPLRSAQVSMIAPLAGTVEARAKVLRRGRNATWVAAEITGETGVGLTATFVFMGPIASALSLDALSPVPADLIAPGDARDFLPERGPAFRLSHLDVRFARPKSPGKRPELCWWVRLRERDGLDAATEALLLADALPPGVLPLLSGTVQVSTMQWQIDMLTAAPTSAGWWLLQSVGDYAQDGCSNQRMMMWDQAGAPVLTGLQSIALFG
jgi:hypothetical protein